MELIQRLQNALATAAVSVVGEGESEPIDLEFPDESFGDIASPMALKLASRAKQPPLAVAQAIASRLNLPPEVATINVVNPGYINFTLSDRSLLAAMADDPAPKSASVESIVIEFGQPNTHKVPHIGHLYSYVYGESLARLFEAVGHRVVRVNYQGDVGLHVAKCLWAYPSLIGDRQVEPSGLEDRVEVLQQAYQRGSLAYDQSPPARRQIDAINSHIYALHPKLADLWDETRGWSLAYYRQFEGRLGIRFDRFYLESETSKVGRRIVEAHTPDVFTRDDGAIVYKPTDQTLHTRVFITSQGNPTYETKELGLFEMKLRDFSKADRLVITTANEQSEYFRVVVDAAKRVVPRLNEVTVEHVGYGLINLKSGKMASRTGDIVTAFWLVDTVTGAMRQRLTEDRHDAQTDLDGVAQKVAIGAIKYSFLKTAAHKDITFDVAGSIAKDGDSAPYLLYTYARCRSLLKRYGESVDRAAVDSLGAIERPVVRWGARYGQFISQAIDDRSPHHVAGYLFELAQRFNRMYASAPILTSPADDRLRRLAVTQLVAEHLKHGLSLLGVETVEAL